MKLLTILFLGEREEGREITSPAQIAGLVKIKW